MTTTTTTSGAADLPEALRSIQRFEVVDCIDDKHVPAVIPKPHGPWVRYEDHIAALAAGQAIAAQAVPTYKDSAFESWYSTYSPAHKSDKQRASDTYAAGMGDPLVTAAPAAVAGPSLYQVMAVAKAIHATTPDADDWDSLRQCEVDVLRGRAEKVLAALAAAPTTQPAHQQEAQEPVAWMTQEGDRVVTEKTMNAARRDGGAMLTSLHSYSVALVRAAAPQPSPAAQGDALDTMRLDWLDADASKCVFHLGKSWYTRPSYGLPYRKRASLREAIDAARKEMP